MTTIHSELEEAQEKAAERMSEFGMTQQQLQLTAQSIKDRVSVIEERLNETEREMHRDREVTGGMVNQMNDQFGRDRERVNEEFRILRTESNAFDAAFKKWRKWT